MANQKKQQDKESNKVRDEISAQQKMTLELMKETIEDQRKSDKKMSEIYQVMNLHMKKCEQQY